MKKYDKPCTNVKGHKLAYKWKITDETKVIKQDKICSRCETATWCHFEYLMVPETCPYLLEHTIADQKHVK